MGLPSHTPPFPRPPWPPPPPPPPKKRRIASRVVKLGAVLGLSALVVAFCAAQDDDEEVTADCISVDSSRLGPDGTYEYLVVDDEYCEDDDDDDDGRSGSSYHAYRWYYGGTRHGSYVSKGTSVRPPHAYIATRSGKVIQRGGFGGRVGGGG